MALTIAEYDALIAREESALSIGAEQIGDRSVTYFKRIETIAYYKSQRDILAAAQAGKGGVVLCSFRRSS